MKRLLSFLFLSLFLLNVLGYYGFFIGLEITNTRHARTRFDNGEYGSEQTVLIKMPLSLPYPLNSKEYERVDGQFKYAGEFYRMVKQKLDNDTLYVVCVKDFQSKVIEEAMTDYVNTFADAPMDNGTSSGKSSPSFIKDYIISSIQISTQSEGWENTRPYFDREVLSTIAFHPSIIHPPERA